MSPLVPLVSLVLVCGSGFLLGLALLFSLSGGFVQRCRRLICASYHPGRELERIQFLRKQILSQRRAEGEALRRSAVQNLAEEGGGEGGGGSRLKTILLRLPSGAHLSHLLGLSSPVSCLACGEVVKSKDNNMVVCHVTRCTGVYCRPCFQSLGNMCVVCTQSLTFQEDSEEELDSSDDEQLSLRSAATRRGRAERSEGGVRAKDDGGRDSELSEADMTYKDQTGSDESDSDASFKSTPTTISTRQDEALVTVLIH